MSQWKPCEPDAHQWKPVRALVKRYKCSACGALGYHKTLLNHESISRSTLGIAAYMCPRCKGPTRSSGMPCPACVDPPALPESPFKWESIPGSRGYVLLYKDKRTARIFLTRRRWEIVLHSKVVATEDLLDQAQRQAEALVEQENASRKAR